jgi:hypothetical protein
LEAVDTLPSPKFQERLAIVPSLSLEVFVKLTVKPELLLVNPAVGAWFVLSTTVTGLLKVFDAPSLSVTVSVTVKTPEAE